MINNSLAENALDANVLDKVFEMWWPVLNDKVEAELKIGYQLEIDYQIQTFPDEKQTYKFLRNRIQGAKDNVKDASLGLGSERVPDYRQKYYETRTKVIKENDIYYRYLCVVGTRSRLERICSELEEFSRNQFFVGFFETIKKPIPMLSFIIIDDKEVLIGAHRRLHAPSERNPDVLVKHPSAVQLFSDYFELLWSQAVKLNEYELRKDLIETLRLRVDTLEKERNLSSEPS